MKRSKKRFGDTDVEGTYHFDNIKADLLILAEEENVLDGTLFDCLLHLHHVITDGKDLNGLVSAVGLGGHLLHDSLGCSREGNYAVMKWMFS